MCRFVLYLGPELSIGSLLTEPDHSIVKQSVRARERHVPLNGDGFGVAWYPPGASEPALFKDVSPAWSNRNLHELARVVRTQCLLAHVRAATPPLPVQQLNCHPFRWRELSFMHNGAILGFPRARRTLLEKLSHDAFDWIQGSTDSEHLFGFTVDAYREQEPGTLAALEAALLTTIRKVEALRVELQLERPAILNLVACDGQRAVVTHYASEGGELESLYVNAGRRYVCEGGVCRMLEPSPDSQSTAIVASEPLSEDPGWEPVPPQHLVAIDADRTVRITPIEL